MDWFLNIFRRWWRSRVEKQFLACLEGEGAEEFLKLLLKLMGLTLKLDQKFQRNVIGFNGRYQFRTADRSVNVAALFNGPDLKVKEEVIPDPDVSVIFKDARALMNYLLASDRDILRLLLNNEVVLLGNMNYILKFGYMSNYIQLALTGKLAGN